MDNRYEVGDDYDYQFQTWEMERIKRNITLNEYEIRINEENQITQLKSERNDNK